LIFHQRRQRRRRRRRRRGCILIHRQATQSHLKGSLTRDVE